MDPVANLIYPTYPSSSLSLSHSLNALQMFSLLGQCTVLVVSFPLVFSIDFLPRIVACLVAIEAAAGYKLLIMTREVKVSFSAVNILRC